ncbi:MAG: hypothetical protein KGH61_01330 [Candidatus Micrarchaeota archaeon]|nr:hypothetical protein [Candidatus Micrarchaeota archaeon]MDE1847574.1 hypothetical protein [Candidatus Micrarchaeota archaeon]MDE1864291.1 hypothetical protein [Candidatus Micrarchaeota archaeon]
MGSSKSDIGKRLSFVRLWTNHIKLTPNKVWSKQYVTLINSVMLSASADVKPYLKVKKAVEKAKRR